MTTLRPRHTARLSNARDSAPPLPGRESSLTKRRRALGLTVVDLAYTARISRGRVSRPDGVALLRIEWVLRQLESGWSLQQVRQVIEYRLCNAGSRATASAAVAGGASTPAGGGGGRRIEP